MTAIIDWDRALRHGAELAVDAARAGTEVGPEDVMWSLFQEAVQTSRSFSAPPRLTYPSKSSLPDTPPEISAFSRIAAYLRGEVEEMPETETSRPRPTADQIQRAEAILHLWHHHAIIKRGNRKRMRKAIYAKANGIAYRRIKAETGLSRTAIYNAQRDAMADMWEAMKALTG